MDVNDFLGSFADENVSFQTRVVRTARVGDNFWKVMVFVEPSRYVDANTAGWETVAGSTTGAKALVVTVDDYADYTSGLLKSWLYDLFCTGFTGDCILVSTGAALSNEVTYIPANPKKLGWYVSDGEGGYVLTEDTSIIDTHSYFINDTGVVVNPNTVPLYSNTSGTVSSDSTIQPSTEYYMSQAGYVHFNEAMEEAYGLLKAYAYHKTVCAGASDASKPISVEAAVALAKLCAFDKNLLSSAPYYPYTAEVTSQGWQLENDPLYAALKAADVDAFMSCYADTTRNVALYALGLAMTYTNGSGTCVGNSMDMYASSMIASSGPGGTGLAKSLRRILNSANIQTWKAVGDNTGNVAAEGAKTIKGDIVQANWIICYIAYMTKVRIAKMITSTANFLKTSFNYGNILSELSDVCSMFGPSGSGRLDHLSITAPSFNNLPEADGDELIIPDAWSATYVDQVRKVSITGALYIGV